MLQYQKAPRFIKSIRSSLFGSREASEILNEPQLSDNGPEDKKLKINVYRKSIVEGSEVTYPTLTENEDPKIQRECEQLHFN